MKKKSMKQQGTSMKDHETAMQTPVLEKKGAGEMSILQPAEDLMLEQMDMSWRSLSPEK